MTKQPVYPSLADLVSAGVRLNASDAATIAREVALRAARGELPGIPSFHVIRLIDDGAIQVEGPVASGREIERAARLLERLLPPLDARGAVRVPGALRLVIARALRVLDLPPFASLDAFAEALHRFAEEDSSAVVSRLVAVWREVISATSSSEPEGATDLLAPVPPQPAELTISDIRRARRATRLTLADIAERSHIPMRQVRELEWGYLANWPNGFTGRAQLVRYARAAGLDERIVLRVALPLLEDWAARAADEMAAPVVTVEPVDVPIEPRHAVQWMESQPLVTVGRTPSRRVRWAAALAIPALLAVGLIPAYWLSSGSDADGPAPPAAVSASKAPGTTEAPAAPARPSPRLDARPEPQGSAAVGTIAAVAFSPAFATTGSAVFYQTGSGARSAIMKADTSSAGEVLRVTRVVDDQASNFHARPSPDGELIAFDSDRDGERGVYVADAEGRDLRRVSGDGFAAVPSWSPDGRTLAFVRAEPQTPRVWNIWTVDLETGRQQRITSHAVGQPWGAAWFPDGKRIAYSHETRLIVSTLDGKRRSVFNSPIAGKLVRTPAVSPDGRRVIFQVYKHGAWVLDVANGRMRKVLPDPTAEEFTWSPDGRRVAYHSRRSGKWGVRVLDAANLPSQ